MLEYHYIYRWAEDTLHFYAPSRKDADRQFEELLGVHPDTIAITVERLNS